MTDIGWARADAPRVRLGRPAWLEAHPAAPERRRTGRDAMLTIDMTGRISDANPAAAVLLGRRADTLCGLAATSILPQLPFAADTPGYNVAYATFHTGDTQWQPHQALTAEGRQVTVVVALACVPVNGRRVITLSLRPAAPEPWKAP